MGFVSEGWSCGGFVSGRFVSGRFVRGVYERGLWVRGWSRSRGFWLFDENIYIYKRIYVYIPTPRRRAYLGRLLILRYLVQGEWGSGERVERESAYLLSLFFKN